MTLVAMFALVTVAQSGRRVRKSEPAAVPVPSPEATQAPTPAAKPAPAFTFIVGMEKWGEVSRVSLYTYSGVLRSCVDRLNSSGSAKADPASNDMSRGDAVRQAKAEKETYVVWLQLRANNYGRPSVYDDASNVYVQYSVLAPVTAKQVTSGNTFPEAYRKSGVIVPSSTTQGDYYLNQAARGAAERILDHFHLRIPGTVPRSISED